MTLTPEEIKACKPGDKVRLDGLVLTKGDQSGGWWNYKDNRSLSARFLTLPGVTVTKLADPDLLLARECAAKACVKKWPHLPGDGDHIRSGLCDDGAWVLSALIAIKAVRGEKP